MGSERETVSCRSCGSRGEASSRLGLLGTLASAAVLVAALPVVALALRAGLVPGIFAALFVLVTLRGARAAFGRRVCGGCGSEDVLAGRRSLVLLSTPIEETVEQG